ncbi:tRNA threonylcarbamoyladenosine biosynthesis protein TsaB [Alteribacillus persepolensis]|uniref:tRNA threonylcarbamoyladenosine biosynthesis protein TsaB n=1 Tax=Alteribacillus persepolensis TaxID=568899 RepID=A0A1G8J619_9BACI|nr:tRNA (adenosine(37)-N6)-threonylcarbamoyltransferase complex dimerization subunit type 1 TsaB [Alteribacillus persepolensis]SDI26437.1 tRNA threonylcarbamoyladenosine biosynthesis protein TsaB [Alteribacillus persepolensis]
MKMLAIDTSTHVMSVGVGEDNKLLGEYTTNFKKNHSVRLMPAIDHLLQELNIQPADLDGIAVAKGPGSYTGVRIGITTAKSMAWALNIPVYAVSSLAVLAQNAKYFSGFISPFMDARRGQVYTGLYKADNGVVQLVEKDRIILLDDWLRLLKDKDKPVLFLGQDWDMHEHSIKEALQDKAWNGDFSSATPRTGELLQLAYTQGAPLSAHEVVPEYTQLTEAEKKWQAANKGKKKHE